MSTMFDIVQFYLNYMGYKEREVDESLLKVYTFYLNYMGYKDNGCNKGN